MISFFKTQQLAWWSFILLMVFWWKHLSLIHILKIQAEIDKVKAKISEQQARLKELEQKKLEAENSEIVDIVRGMSISLTELPLLFEKLKDGGTLGQSVPKSEEEKKEEN